MVDPIVRDAMLKTWAAIEGELFQAMREGGEDGPLSRDEVVELVVNEGEMEVQAGRSPELARFRELSYEDQVKMGREVFTSRTYKA
jgi:hypothetical protein